MAFFDKEENVQQYMKMVEDYDGEEIISVLKKYASIGSKVLELGMGPGIDFDLLRDLYIATGSDSSKVFLELYRSKHPDSDILLLDAVKINTKKMFDCIYSNKVLMHLSKDELRTSFQNQYNRLNENGILFHTMWFGDKEEIMHGLRFVYYTKETIREQFDDKFEIIKFAQYKEIEKDDSFYIVLRKK